MATYAEITTVEYSGDIRVDSLLDDSTLSWNYILPSRTTLYYTFETSVISTRASGVTGFNATQVAAAQALLSYASSVTGIAFAEVASGASADFHFGNSNVAGATTAGLTMAAWSYSQSSGGQVTAYTADAFVLLDNAEFAAINVAPAPGNTGYEILLHEIGHALGLGHPFDSPYALPAGQDNTGNTVMSYTHSGGAKSTFQSYDLLALRWIFGEDGLRGSFGYNSIYGSSLTLAPVIADDFAASSATTGVLTIAASITGSLEAAGDRDWFAVSLASGTRYAFDLKGAASGDGSLADPVLRLVDAAGNTIATSNDAGGSLNSRIEWTAAGSGLYFLEAASQISAGTGTYRLSAASTLANRAPIALADAFAGPEDGVLSGNVLTNDSDLDAQVLTAVVESQPGHGSLSLQANGQFSYVPAAHFNGVDSFVYRASDASLSALATVTLTVTPVNDRPVALAALVSVVEDTPVSGVLPLATDVDADPLSYSKASNPAHGSLTVTSSGQFTYVPVSQFSGTDSFTYTVSDGSLSSSASVTLVVAGVNDAPVSATASIAVDEDTRASGRLPGASDPDGDSVSYTQASGPSHGTVTIENNGQYTYVPAANYFGEDAFAFRVSDPAGASSAYLVAVTVRGMVDDVFGTPDSDVLTDASGDARLSGLLGHDRLLGGSGNDTLDGGAGIDTAVYVQPAGAYRVARVGSGWRVTDRQGGDGLDVLIDVERLEFAGKAFDLVKPPVAGTPAYGGLDHFLFDPVYYLLEYGAKVPTATLVSAWQSYAGSGAAQHRQPNSWFDARYYADKWSDLGALNLDDLSLFRHFNLFGVWEGRAPGPAFDRFDPDAYLTANPDVAGYIDGHLADFLGSRANGAIAHFILYGEAEGRQAVDRAGQGISLDYVVDLMG